MKKYAAFSLIELMIILAVVAILVALGVPKITQVTQNNRIIEVTNKISSYLKRARSEAINRTSQVGIVATGGGGTNWMVGWDIYLDANSNSQFEAGETILLTVGNQNIPNVTIVGPLNGVAYTATGRKTINVLAGAGPTATFTITDLTPGGIPPRTLTVNAAGRRLIQ